MSENLYGGGVPQPGNSGVGEVEGYRMIQFELNDKNSLELVFEKTFESGKSIALKGWINDVDPEKIVMFEGQTKEVALTKAFTKVKRNIWDLVRNYADDAAITAAQKRVNSWESLVNEAKSCLPPNFSEIEGTLVVGYKDNGFLAFPQSMQWDSASSRYLPFFSVEKTKMRGLGNLNLVKPETEDENTPSEPVSW